MENNEEKLAHFEQVKQSNRRNIRDIIIRNGMIGKKELSKEAGLTFPTVTVAIRSLLETGEILGIQEESSGGRPGAVFCMNPDYQYYLNMIVKEFKIIIRIYDACGNLKEEVVENITENGCREEIIQILTKKKQDYPKLSFVSIGIPGVVNGDSIDYLPYLSRLEGKELKQQIEKTLNVVVLMQNDVNAIVISERGNWRNFAHIFMNHGCIGLGMIAEGQVLHGAHGCAGELEYVCDESKGTIEVLREAIMIVSAVLDVSDIAISGEEILETDIRTLEEKLECSIPKKRIPVIHFVEGEMELYHKGLLDLSFEQSRKL
ncbi:MAG: ROK family protein [Lachnospiraceae bacterium]|nr:ROK family protein [Lachnospiraceae bacterium]